MTITETKVKNAFDTLKGTFGYKNVWQGPRLVKVVVSSGTGKNREKGRGELVADRLAKITGQKAAARAAKQSIASFKLREGDIVGYQVTLRGASMYNFLDKVLHIALPRTRDFRGLSATSFDDMGNYTFGIKENSIFPEASEEDLRDVFGLAITVVTTARSKEEARAFLTHLGFPLKKEDVKA